MEALQVGDYVKIGHGESYEQVYAFAHRVPDRVADFVKLHTNAGSPLEMTSEHLVFVNGKTNPVRAGSIKVGDILHAEGNNNAVVNKIEVVTKRGIYNPLTRFRFKMRTMSMLNFKEVSKSRPIMTRHTLQ